MGLRTLDVHDFVRRHWSRVSSAYPHVFETPERARAAREEFFGRAALVDAVTATVRSRAYDVANVRSAPGAGATRFAIEVARHATVAGFRVVHLERDLDVVVDRTTDFRPSFDVRDGEDVLLVWDGFGESATDDVLLTGILESRELWRRAAGTVSVLLTGLPVHERVVEIAGQERLYRFELAWDEDWDAGAFDLLRRLCPTMPESLAERLVRRVSSGCAASLMETVEAWHGGRLDAERAERMLTTWRPWLTQLASEPIRAAVDARTTCGHRLEAQRAVAATALLGTWSPSDDRQVAVLDELCAAQLLVVNDGVYRFRTEALRASVAADVCDPSVVDEDLADNDADAAPLLTVDVAGCLPLRAHDVWRTLSLIDVRSCDAVEEMLADALVAHLRTDAHDRGVDAVACADSLAGAASTAWNAATCGAFADWIDAHVADAGSADPRLLAAAAVARLHEVDRASDRMSADAAIGHIAEVANSREPPLFALDWLWARALWSTRRLTTTHSRSSCERARSRTSQPITRGRGPDSTR